MRTSHDDPARHFHSSSKAVFSPRVFMRGDAVGPELRRESLAAAGSEPGGTRRHQRIDRSPLELWPKGLLQDEVGASSAAGKSVAPNRSCGLCPRRTQSFLLADDIRRLAQPFSSGQAGKLIVLLSQSFRAL